VHLRPAASWHFRAIKLDQDGYFIDSNLDFTAINREYHRSISATHSSIGEAFLLSGILEAIADLQVGAEYLAEIATNRKSSSILQQRSERILAKHARSTAEISAFQEMELGNGNAIRDALNSGERTFADFLDILEKGERFKTWLRGRNPDEVLTAEYYKAATAETWIEKLPTKTLRWAIFAGLGLAAGHELSHGLAAATELGLGAGDAFVLDKILKGWKPNQFIEGPLKNSFRSAVRYESALCAYPISIRL
jgi:hypothetical protein